MDAESLSGMYKSNLQYEQYSTKSFVPMMVEYLDPAADAEAVAVLADRWGGICCEIAEHVYAEFRREPTPSPILSDYMHGVTAMIIGLRSNMGAQGILHHMQNMRATCKLAMSSNEAALQNKAKLFEQIKRLVLFSLKAATKERERSGRHVQQTDYHHQFASPRQRLQVQESYYQLMQEDNSSQTTQQDKPFAAVQQDRSPETSQVVPTKRPSEAHHEAVKKPKWLCPTTHFGPSLATPKQHARSTSASAALTPLNSTMATSLAPHRTLVHLSKQSPLLAATTIPLHPLHPLFATVQQVDVIGDNVQLRRQATEATPRPCFIATREGPDVPDDKVQFTTQAARAAQPSSQIATREGSSRPDDRAQFHTQGLGAFQPSHPAGTVNLSDIPDNKVVVVIDHNINTGEEAKPEKGETKETPIKNVKMNQATLVDDAVEEIVDDELMQATPKEASIKDKVSSQASTPSSAGPKTPSKGRGGRGPRRAAEGKGRGSSSRRGVVKVGVLASEGRGGTAGVKSRVPDREPYKPGRGRGRGRGVQRTATNE